MEKEIATRLRSWGLSRYQSLKSFAVALQMSQPSLSSYVNAKRRPGVDIQSKLRALGCDIEWLMTGREQSSQGGVSVSVIKEPGGIYGSLNDLPSKTRTQIEQLVHELSALDTDDVEKVREIVRMCFPQKKQRRQRKPGIRKSTDAPHP